MGRGRSGLGRPDASEEAAAKAGSKAFWGYLKKEQTNGIMIYMIV